VAGNRLEAARDGKRSDYRDNGDGRDDRDGDARENAMAHECLLMKMFGNKSSKK
jgi:hypothetical protein